MNYFFVIPHSCGEYDEQTTYIRQPRLIAQNIGLDINWWPPDDMFKADGAELFCTDRLKSLLETDYQKFSGIQCFKPVDRINTGANWKGIYSDMHPGRYWNIVIDDKPMKDDFGLWAPMRYLVVSERALKFLSHNHVTEVLGLPIEGDVDLFFQKYIESQKANNYSLLPPKLIEVNIIGSPAS